MTEQRAWEQRAWRPELYRWLAGVFAREPSPQTLASYRSGDGRAFLRHLAELPGCHEGAGALLALVGAHTDTEAFALELAGAFGFLFHGAGGPSAVPPYESVYTSPQGRMFQKATTDMERLLAEHGMSVSGTPEPADHIAVELEFLAQLTADSLDGSDAVVEARRRAVLRDHLLVWGPEFCDLCIERDRNGFYAAAARILRAMLRNEAEPQR